MKDKHFHATKIQPIVQVTARIVQKNPAIADNPGHLMTTLAENIQGFADKSVCPGCGASMTEYVYSVTAIDALLLIGMAKEVRNRLEQNPNFTEANQVRISNLDGLNRSSKQRQGYTGKLGLIAKYRTVRGTQKQGTWSITKRGWAALRGEPIPKSVIVFRGEILERPDDTVTLSQLFRSYSSKAEKRKAGSARSDYRKEMEAYDPSEWREIADIHQHSLLP